MAETVPVPCPGCGSTDVKKVTYTWWGGALGPRVFNHTKCNACKTTYNGKTGKSNVTPIIIYNIAIIVVCVILYLLVMNLQ